MLVSQFLFVNEECARRLFQFSELGKSKQKQADEESRGNWRYW